MNMNQVKQCKLRLYLISPLNKRLKVGKHDKEAVSFEAAFFIEIQFSKNDLYYRQRLKRWEAIV